MRRKKIKYKPKEYNWCILEVNMLKYSGQIRDTTILSAADKRRLYK